MKEKYTDSVQNRFTAYLVAAVTNKRIHYMKYKKRLQEQEFLQVDLQEKHYLDFDRQYHDYIGEQTEFIMEDWERFQDLLILLESEKLMKAVNRLKERERKLLFARVFGELTFTELREKFGMKPKQAEMTYYYVIRKLRKELEGLSSTSSKTAAESFICSSVPRFVAVAASASRRTEAERLSPWSCFRICIS